MNEIANIFRSKRKAGAVYDLNDVKRVPSFKGIMQILFYSIDFLLFKPVLWKRKFRGALIIYDRYFYDYFIQSFWDSVSLKFKSICCWFVPKPDLIILLKADPDVIYERKPELDKDVIRDQQVRAKNLPVSVPIIEINTDQGIETSARDIVCHILKTLELRNGV